MQLLHFQLETYYLEGMKTKILPEPFSFLRKLISMVQYWFFYLFSRAENLLVSVYYAVLPAQSRISSNAWSVLNYDFCLSEVSNNSNQNW